MRFILTFDLDDEFRGDRMVMDDAAVVIERLAPEIAERLRAGFPSGQLRDELSQLAVGEWVISP